jgi:hypothetical protein
MSHYNEAPEGKDPALWEIAQKRASFKSHLAIYLVINAFMWSIWFFNQKDHGTGYPWPVWTTLGWGIGVAFHYIGAYVYPKANSVEREYEKLKNQNK